MTSPSQSPCTSRELVLLGFRIFKALQALKAAQCPLPVKDTSLFEACVHALLSEDVLSDMSQQHPRWMINTRTLLHAATHFLSLLRLADPANSKLWRREMLKEVVDILNSSALLQMSMVPRIDIAGTEDHVMRSTEYMNHVQTSIIHDHLQRRWNHQLPDEARFTEPTLEAFWLRTLKKETAIDWDVLLMLTYKELDEEQQQMVREVLECAGLKEALKAQMTDGPQAVTVASMQAFISESTAFEYPAAFMESVASLHRRIPVLDAQLRTLLADVKLPPKALHRLAEAGITLEEVLGLTGDQLRELAEGTCQMPADQLPALVSAVESYRSEPSVRESVDRKAAGLQEQRDHETLIRAEARGRQERQGLEAVKTWLGIPCSVVKAGLVKGIPSAKCPRGLADLLPYVQRVNEYTRGEAEQLAVAHLCKRYVLERAKEHAGADPRDRTTAEFVISLEEDVETEQQLLRLSGPADACPLVAAAALGLYSTAMASLRGHTLSRDVANTLHVVTTLLHVATHFSSLTPQLQRTLNDAGKARAEVLRCIREGIPFFAMPEDAPDEGDAEYGREAAPAPEFAVTQLAEGLSTADAAEAEGEAAVTVAEVTAEPVADVTDGANTAEAAPADGEAAAGAHQSNAKEAAADPLATGADPDAAEGPKTAAAPAAASPDPVPNVPPMDA